jgi:hypothetical protein
VDLYQQPKRLVWEALLLNIEYTPANPLISKVKYLIRAGYKFCKIYIQLVQFLTSKGQTYCSATRGGPKGPYSLANWYDLTAKDFIYPQSYIELDNNRPYPVLPSDTSENKFEKVDSRSIVANYIAPRYQDWIEAGGLWLQRQGLIDCFWIDLWSEESLDIYANPESDPHPQI